MFGRRRRGERDELMLMHARIAEIHADMVRRDEELRLDLGTRRQLIQTLEELTSVARSTEERLRVEATLVGELQRVLRERDDPAIDLTSGPRVLGGSVEGTARPEARRLDA